MKKGSYLNSHLSKKQLAELKELILSEIERIVNKQALNLATLSEVETKSGDEVDSANDHIIAHAEFRFATRETLYLKKLRKTLAMMDTDEYGICEDCNAPIQFGRLVARPTSTLCISCKEESERDELQNFHGRKSKSLGQQMNLAVKA